MNLLQVVDLGEGKIEVGWRWGNELPRHHSPLPFEDPLSAEDRRELRWYLEEYLQFPYGAEESHARRVEEKMAEWGEALFSQVFPKAEADPDPRGFYQEAVRSGLEQCELCVSSETTEFLNIPWELIRDPTPGRGYLAPSLGGLYRQRSGQAIQAPLEISPDEPFRILLIIARPLGDKDIPLGTVSRPMLEALRPLRPQVQLEVLRPPTFQALVKRLEDSPGFYHLVHFDGHGVFAPLGGDAAMAYGAKLGRGHLVFEKDDGTEDIINSEDLGQALATCKVPLFVLNACQSAEEGKADAYSSVASQLVAIGAKGVVAMSYSVYADAAASFIKRFYEKLVGGALLSAAVAAGRKQLFAQPNRASVVGNLELRDWVVPTLYQQEQGYVPAPRAEAVMAGEEGTEEAVQPQEAEEVCPAGRFGFIGRDYDILRIERALRDDNSPWVLISGMGGIGKTELAFGFARWYAETGGCPGGVFAISFKEKADFGQVIGSIVGYGTDFSRLSDEDQWQYLVGYLREKPCLLVWDNFETVAGYPAGAEPLATEEERETLSKFVKALRGGKSRILITTRKQAEDWLGIAPELIELGGLTQRDAGLLAREILKTVGRKPEEFRQDPQYSELIKLLRGHPRSLEVVLPHLRSRSPAELIDAIQHRADDLGESLEDASLTYAFHQLSEKAQKHLPFLGLFVSFVYADTLGLFVASGDEQEEAYVELVGEAMDDKAWEEVLDEAAACGLLRSLGSRIYELHPTLPPFLRSELESIVGEEGLRGLDAEFLNFYRGLAVQLDERVREGQSGPVAMARAEEANFLRALRVAERKEEWKAAQLILQMLGGLYEVRGRADEWIALRSRALAWVGRDAPLTSDWERGVAWMYLVGDEALFALKSNALESAEADYRRILEFLVSQHDPAVEPQIALGYHQLGRIAQERNRLDEAEEWYRKALGIYERPGLERWAAREHHQLGRIAQERNRLDGAEEWYRKALEIFERLGLERDAADEYHQLGRIAQERNRLDEAEEWYRKALEIFERLGLERDAAIVYHQLGRIAQERNRLDEAEEWYRKALEICEQLGLERDAAGDYHQLGMIAQERNRFDEAGAWYRKALEICERLGLERDAATVYHQLGRMAQERNRFDDAEGWCRKALEIRERLGLEREAATDYHQLGIIAQLRNQSQEAEGWYRRALEIFERLGLERYAVGDYHQLGMIAQERNRLDEAGAWYRKALEICERLGLEREAAIVYHQLGTIAQERNRLDEAEGWYRKAVEIYRKLGHPPLMVKTLAQMGRLRWQQGKKSEAVPWLGRALAIAGEYQMMVAGQILADLARLLQSMGEDEFGLAWKDAFEAQDPPLELLREVLRQLGDEDASPEAP
jgi:tetratricopeptide (TPR) repeat protein